MTFHVVWIEGRGKTLWAGSKTKPENLQCMTLNAAPLCYRLDSYCRHSGYHTRRASFKNKSPVRSPSSAVLTSNMRLPEFWEVFLTFHGHPWVPSCFSESKWLLCLSCLSGCSWTDKQKERKAWLPLGMVEKKVYCRDEGGHVQRHRWRNLGKFAVDVARLSWIMRTERGRREAREQRLTQRGGLGQETDQEAKWPKWLDYIYRKSSCGKGSLGPGQESSG